MLWARYVRLKATSLSASATWHWFKLAVLIYKMLNHLSLQYLVDDWQLTTIPLAADDLDVATCEIPRTRTSLGNCWYTVAGPHMWNNVPVHLCDSELTFLKVCWLLKMHMFCWGRRCLVTFAFRVSYKFAFALHYITSLCPVWHASRVIWLNVAQACNVKAPRKWSVFSI